MKNFSKKLSFVMATAMVVTSLYAPQGAEAATKNKIVEKNSKSAVKRKNIYIGGQVVDFDAVVKGKVVKDSKGTWKSSDSKIASVDKNGKVKARKNGRVTISFKTKATKKTKSVTVKMTIDARTRASKMTLTPSAVVVKEGEKSTVGVNYEISKKIKAAGGKATTYKLFVESSDEKVAKAYVEGNNKIVVEGVAKSATPVSITVYSAQVYKLENAKKVKYKLTEKFDVKVNSKLEAKQTGANKITVMGSDFVASKAAFVIKNSSGGVLPIKDEIKLNEAKTEAILEGTTTQIPAGKYTLTYNNGDTVEFEVVKAVVKRIEIVPSNTAIMAKAQVVGGVVQPVTDATAYYKVFNQFDEDVTKDPIAARIQISGSDNASMGKRGEIKFKTASAAGYQLNLSKVSVAVVDLDTGVNAQALLTVGEAAKVWESEYKGLFNTTTRKFVDSITDGDKLANYTLLFKAKDQYGNPLVDEANQKEIQLNLLSVTGVVADNVKIVSIGDESYYAFPLKNSAGTENATRAGEVTVQTVVINNGKTEVKKFEVVSSTKVDTLTVRAGALGVYANQDNVLDFTALDANGKEITSWEALKQLNDSKYLQNYADGAGSGRKLMFVKKSDGKVALIYNPGSINPPTNTSSVTQVLTFVTQTTKFSSATIAVRAKRIPSTILGLSSDAAKGVTSGRDLTVEAGDIRFQDQYGNNMTAKEVVASAETGKSYKIKVTLVGGTTDPNFTLRAGGTDEVVTITGGDTEVIKLTAKAIAKTDSSKIKLELYYNTTATTVAPADKVESSEDKTVEMYATLLKDMSNFSIEDPGLVPASNLDTAAQKGFKPEVVGYYAGQKIALVASTGTSTDDFAVFGAKEYTAGTATDLLYAPVPEIDSNIKNTVVEKTKVRVIINDNKGTEVEREFSYSNEPRKVNKVTVSDPVSMDDSANGWGTPDNLKSSFTVKDQYGSLIDVAPYITYSDYDKDVVEVADNGKTTAKISFKSTVTANTETAVTVRLQFPKTSYVFEKVVIFKKS